MIDTRLVTFMTVAKTGNYTKAGQILNLTQPAVSQHIKYLEHYYGTSLVDKNSKGIYLTSQGEVLLKYVNRMFNLSEEARREVQNCRPKYIIGATMTIGGYVLPYILGMYRQIYDEDVILKVENTQNILEELASGKLHLAVVEGAFDKTKFKFKKLKDDELILVASPNHPFAKKAYVNIDEIIKGNLILREQGSGTRTIFERYLGDYGYLLEDTNVYMEIGDINAIISLVEAGLGYSVISREAVRGNISANTLVQVPIEGIKMYREFNFVYLNAEDDFEFIDRFMMFCIKEVEKK